MNSLFFIPLIIFVIIFCLEQQFPQTSFENNRKDHTLNNLSIALLASIINIYFFENHVGNILLFISNNTMGIMQNISFKINFLKMLVAIILFDFWMYIWHRANHQFSILWRLHQAHHNDITMDSTTAFRFHPIEIVLASILNLGIFVVLGLNLQQIIIYNLIFQPVILFHHSNIKIPQTWDRVLRSIIVTPGMHRIHHSVKLFQTDSNYGSIFSFWDRLFKTVIIPVESQVIVYGLPVLRDKFWQNFRGFLKIPFVNQGEEGI